MVKAYILLLVLSLFISITLLEGLLILGLIALILSFFKEKKIYGGKLFVPILLFALPTLLSTFLFHFRKFIKAVEEGVFQLVYFTKIEKKDADFLTKTIPYLFLIGFFLLLPFEIYSLLKYKEPRPIWGGVFETGFFYTLFGITFLLFFIKERRYLFLFGFSFSLLIVILSYKRSMILAFIVMFFIVLFLLYRSKHLSRGVFLTFLSVFLVIGAGGYLYLSKIDHRFKTFNEVLLGKKKLNEETLNVILSGRYTLFKEGMEVIKEDIKEKRILQILIGHGVRAKEYLTPRSPIVQPRYESFFLFSEFIERGIVGIIGIILIYIIYFKELLTFRIKENSDFFRLILLIPLGIHLIQTIFTYFWDAMLPVFFILFKVYESSKGRQS